MSVMESYLVYDNNSFWQSKTQACKVKSQGSIQVGDLSDMTDKDIPREWCEHPETHMLGWVDRAELGGGYYTNFYLMKCTKCKQYVGFPDGNYQDAVKAGWKPEGKVLQKLTRWWKI